MSLRRLLDMEDKRVLVWQVDMAHAAPIFVGIVRLHSVGFKGRTRSVAGLGLEAGQGRLVFFASNDERPRRRLGHLTATLDLLPWCIIVSDLVDEWVDFES